MPTSAREKVGTEWRECSIISKKNPVRCTGFFLEIIIKNYECRIKNDGNMFL